MKGKYGYKRKERSIRSMVPLDGTVDVINRGVFIDLGVE